MTELEQANWEAWISRGLDGELNQDEFDRLQRVLSHDSNACALRTAWAAQGDILRNLPVPIGPDPELIWQQVQQEMAPGRVLELPRRRWWSTAVAAAVAGCVAGVVWWTGRAPTAPLAALPPSTSVEFVEAELPNHIPMVFVDADSGATIIWTEEWIDEESEVGG